MSSRTCVCMKSALSKNSKFRLVCVQNLFAGGLGLDYGPPPTMDAWLPNVKCAGTETDILDCPNGGWFTDCLSGPKEAAAAICIIGMERYQY